MSLNPPPKGKEQKRRHNTHTPKMNKKVKRTTKHALTHTHTHTNTP